MPQPDASHRPRPTSRRDLLRLDFRRDPEQLSEAIHALLSRSTLSAEERVQVLGGALVLEALRPYWGGGRSPAEAHAAVRRHDPELADAIEALAPMLLGRAQAREEAAEALDAVEALLRGL